MTPEQRAPEVGERERLARMADERERQAWYEVEELGNQALRDDAKREAADWRTIAALLRAAPAPPEPKGWRPDWICEFCYRPADGPLSKEWDWIYQSAVCPDCKRRVQHDGGYAVVKGGAYAYAEDPRPFVRATPAGTEGERRIEGWAAAEEANCSCEQAATFEFNAECRHRGLEWGQRATLILREEPAREPEAP